MSTQENANKLAEALRATKIAEPINVTHKDGAVEVVFRVQQQAIERWLRIIGAIKDAEERESEHPHKWRSRIFKEYYRRVDPKTGNRETVYGWVFYVQSNMMPDSLDMIAGAMRMAQPAPPKRVVELDEMPMTGLPPDYERGAPKPGSEKGAYKFGKANISFGKGNRG